MSFQELPTNQKLLFVAHAMVAIAGFLAAYANVMALAQQGALPSEVLKNTPQPATPTGKSRSGFFE